MTTNDTEIHIQLFEDSGDWGAACECGWSTWYRFKSTVQQALVEHYEQVHPDTARLVVTDE